MLYLFIILFEFILLFFLSKSFTRSLSRLLFVLTKSQDAVIHMIAFLFLPGIIIHELSHLFSASLLFVPVGEIEFYPKIIGDRVKLGSVQVGRTDPLRRAIIGFAPVLVGAIILCSLLWIITTSQTFFSLPSWLSWAILFYSVFELSSTMFSSRKDAEGAIELLITLLILGIGYFFASAKLGLPPLSFSFLDGLLVGQIGDGLKRLNMLLLIPLGLDLVLIFLANTLARRI